MACVGSAVGPDVGGVVLRVQVVPVNPPTRWRRLAISVSQQLLAKKMILTTFDHGQARNCG